MGLRRTVSHTAIYSIGVVIQNITSIVMIPIYTRYLSPSDYGLIEILGMVLDVTTILFGMRVDQGLFRYFYAAKDDAERNQVVSTTFLLTLGLNAVGMLAIMATSPFLSAKVLGDSHLAGILVVYSLCMLAPAFVGLPYSYARLHNRPGTFLVLSLTKLATQVSLNVLFVVVLEMKASGVILSTIATQLGLGLVYSTWMLRKTGIGFRRDIAAKLYAFSLPLVLSSIASFYIVFGDRYFLREAWGLAAVGIYGLAYRCGFGFVSLTYEPFTKAWAGHKYEVLSSPNPLATYQLVFNAMSKLMLVAALGASVFIHDILNVFVGPEFRVASSVVPILLSAFVFRVLGDYSNFGLLLKEKTRHLAHAAWIAAGVMTVGYLVLIPRYGIMGAALTTFAGFVTEAVWIYIFSRRQYDMKLEIWRFGIAAATCVCTYFLCELIRTPTLASMCLRLLVVLLAVALIYCLPSTSDQERRLAMRALQFARDKVRPVLTRF